MFTGYINDPVTGRRLWPILLTANDGSGPATAEVGAPVMFFTGTTQRANLATPLVDIRAASGLYGIAPTQAELAVLAWKEKGTLLVDTATCLPDGVVLEADFLPIVLEGTLQAGTASTVTLPASASAVNGAYVGGVFFPVGGTAAGALPREIAAYDGGTKVATFATPFLAGQIPDATTVFQVGMAAPSGDLLAQIFGAPIATYGGVAGSFGEKWTRQTVDAAGGVSVFNIEAAALLDFRAEVERVGGPLAVLRTLITDPVGVMFSALAAGAAGVGVDGSVSARNFATAPTTAAIRTALIASPGTEKITVDASGRVTPSTVTPAAPDATTVAAAVATSIANDEVWSYTPVGNPATVQVVASVVRAGVAGHKTLTFAIRGTAPNLTYELVGVGAFGA